MGIEVKYDGATVTTAPKGGVRLVESANMGTVGQGSIVIDDTAGALTLVGHKVVRVTEDDCTDEITFRGFASDRRFVGRDRMKTGLERSIEVSTLDMNAKLGFKVVRGGAWRKRPVEEVGERLTDLLASGFLGLVDNGFVDYPDAMVDGGDLRGMHPGDILADLATRVGFNFFGYWDEDETEGALWFRDSNTSLAYSSTLRISNVLEDLDTLTADEFYTGTTFAPSKTTALVRTPAQTVSGVWMPFKKGNVYRTRAATEATYEPRDGTAPSSRSRRRSRARAQADRYLFTHRNEDDQIATTIRVPSSKVNLVKAGHRIQCRFSHLAPEGYGAFSWFRVLERTVIVPAGYVGEYDIDLTLSPQESNECSVEPTFVQYIYQDSEGVDGPQWTNEFSLPAPSSPGNLLVVAALGSDLNVGEVISGPTGWTEAFANVPMADDMETDMLCHVWWKKSAGEQTAQIRVENVSETLRGVMLEYAGLANPTLYDQSAFNKEDDQGYAIVPATDYPSGPALVLPITFMRIGPQSGDELQASGTGLTLRTPIDSGEMGTLTTPSVGVADHFRDANDSGGTTPVYPAAGGWRFLFTDDEPTLTVGLTFVGDNC